MHGNKIGEQNLLLKAIKKFSFAMHRAHVPSFLACAIFLLSSGCVMTKAQGEKLSFQVNNLEDEVAKLQRVRHDMEVLLVGQVRDLFERLGKLETNLASLRESLYEGSNKSTELVAELQYLRGELEQAQFRYRDLEKNQKSLAENQNALAEAQKKIRIPPLKDDHYAAAKKYYLGGKLTEAIYLLEQFLKEYPNERELRAQSNYLLGEIYRNMGDSASSNKESEINHKKSVVSYQKVVEMYKSSILREEALYKMGTVLKSMGNTEGATTAFKELLRQNAKSKRAVEAKRHLKQLAKK